MILHCFFALLFSNSDIEYLFMCLLAMSMSFLRNVYLYLDLLSFSFFAIELYELFVYFGD